jgi:hypothetical protein
LHNDKITQGHISPNTSLLLSHSDCEPILAKWILLALNNSDNIMCMEMSVFVMEAKIKAFQNHLNNFSLNNLQTAKFSDPQQI